MIDVDCADVSEYSDADSVIAVPVADSRCKIREGSAIGRIPTETADLVRNLGVVSVSLFVSPEAECAAFLQFLWQFFVHICFPSFPREFRASHLPLEVTMPF